MKNSKTFRSELEERASFLYQKEVWNFADLKQSICYEFKIQKVGSHKHIELNTKLGITASCELEIGSILDAYEDQCKSQNISSIDIAKTLIKALCDVELHGIAEKIKKPPKKMQSKVKLGWGIVIFMALLVFPTVIYLTTRDSDKKEGDEHTYSEIKAKESEVGFPNSVRDSESEVKNASQASENDSKINNRSWGVVGINGKSLNWLKSCPSSSKYTMSLDWMTKKKEYYGVVQLGDDIWLCGGRTGDRDPQQSMTCQALSLVDGKWRHLKDKMNLPRIKPVMFLFGRKVVVMGGTTSDVNSKTGCRDTQEVFDLDNPGLGWQREDIEDNHSCYSSTEIVHIECG